MNSTAYSLNVLVNGRSVKEYSHEGMTFIEAKNGTEFSVEVKNNSYSRVLAIVSVDGLDVIDGKAANNDSRGYVIAPWSNVIIKGWRKSSDEVGAFKFVSGKKSYAAGKGSGQNNGVIAVRVFQEKVETKRILPEYKGDIIRNCKLGGMKDTLYAENDATYSRETFDGSASGWSSADMAATKSSTSCYSSSAKGMSAANFDTGTTWGTKLADRVETTIFERGLELGTSTIYYASRESLVDMGVKLLKEQKISAFPQAFNDAFARPPKGWK